MASPINPARIDFVTLRLFCAVAQTGSITKGAASCHLAVSAASRRLAEFETTAGTRLFERGPRGISLTVAGHIAMQHSIRLFQGFEQFGRELRDYSTGIRGHVRLWANMSALTEFLPAALTTFLDTHSEVRVEVEEQLSGDIVRALLDGLADIGVFAENAPANGLELTRFQSDDLVVLCPRGHPLGHLKQTDFKSCLAHTFVGLNPGSSLLELATRAAKELDTPLLLRVQVRSFDAMCHMIAANLGIGIAPLAACRPLVKSLGLKVVRLNEKWAKRQLMLACKSRKELSPTAETLMAHLISVSNNGASLASA